MYVCLAFLEKNDLPKISIISLIRAILLKYSTDFQEQIILMGLKGVERISVQQRTFAFRHRKT